MGPKLYLWQRPPLGGALQSLWSQNLSFGTSEEPADLAFLSLAIPFPDLAHSGSLGAPAVG